MPDLASLSSILSAPALAALKSALEAPAQGPILHRKQYRNLKVTLAPAATDEDQQAALRAAFEEVAFPEGDRIPLASELTPAQRALALAFTDVVVDLRGWAIPKAAWVRRRWLGLETGATETPVRFAPDGVEGEVPLWYALQELARSEDDDAEERRVALLRGLPLSTRIEAFGDFALGAYGVDTDDLLSPDEWGALGEAGKAWAPRYADQLVEIFADDALHLERGEETSVPDQVKPPLTHALLLGGIPIEERWDPLLSLPVHDEAELSFTRRLLRALPAERRGKVVLAAMKDAFPRGAVRMALKLLDDVPDPAIAEAVLALADDVERWPRRDILAELGAIAARHPAVDAVVAPVLAALPPLRVLTIPEVFGPNDVSELSEIQKAQCARGSSLIMGCGTDWVNEEEIAYLELARILDATGQHVYDLALFMDEDGQIFTAGTTDIVATVCQEALYCDDPALKEALQGALAKKPRRARAPDA